MSAHQLLPQSVLPLLLLAAVCCNALLAAAIAGSKILRERCEGRATRVRDSVLESAIQVLEGERDDVGLPGAHTADGAAALKAIVGLIAAIRGDARARLIRLLEEHGYIDALIAGLQSRDPVRRSECAMLLGGAHSPRAVDALNTLVHTDPAPEVRMMAAEAAGTIAELESVPVLLQALQEPARFHQLRIAGVLASMGPVAVPQLEAAVQTSSGRFLALVLDILADIRIVEHPERIVALLRHPSPEIRARAATVLGGAGAVDSVPHLVGTAGDPAWFVRVRAAKALRLLGVPDREPALSAYYACLERLLRDEVWHVRRNAAAALAAAGERGVGLLISAGTDVARAAVQAEQLAMARSIAAAG